MAKLSSSGAVSYATFIGGNGDDSGVSIVVDSNGNAFVAGNTQASSGFPTTTTLGPVFGQDCFVAEFDSNGARTFSTVIGGSGVEVAEGIAIDSSGIYVAGQTSSSNLFTSPVRPFSGGTDDGFVAKLSNDGTSLTYGTYVGGSALDLATGIAVDSSNNAYVSGITLSSGLSSSSTFGGVEDGLRRAVVLLEPDHGGILEVVLELQDVPNVRSAEPINCLVFVPHHAQIPLRI